MYGGYGYLYVFVFLLLLYASLYYIFYDEIILYQVEARHFDFNLLYNKQPIIIQDSITNIDEILVDWFNYNIVEYDVLIPNIWGWNRNHYKYFVIYAPDTTNGETTIEITLGNPLTKQEGNVPEHNQTLTTIQLNNNKMLIIPFKWYYHINIISGNPRFFGIHDYITYGLSFGVKGNR
jgi:hypothetical protein